ncbi:PRC-barrel domain-containing protein [Candidatus Micrarchaeota archaeon]|nr:PRC-barrel domain-containing protein [Candidatus Micrarchaeota archaeon]
MTVYALPSQLIGKKIYSTDGEEVGQIEDLLLDENTGKLESALISPNPESSVADGLVSEESHKILPYASILSVKQVVVVDSRTLKGAAKEDSPYIARRA